MKKDVIVFGVSKDNCQLLGDKLSEQGYTFKLSLSTRKHLNADISKLIEVSKDKQIILVFKNDELKDVTEIFHDRGITDLSVFPYDTHLLNKENVKLEDCVIPIDNTKPRLSYVEAEVSECCNLNCKGCSEFSNLVESNRFCNLTIFKKDLEKLKEFYWGIGKIRLLGGEPLMNPDFHQFVVTARELFPDSDIRLVSNGLLVPKITEQDFAILKSNNCSFDISNYPPTQKNIETITDCLKKAEIPYNLSIPINMFFKSLLAQPTESPTKAFNKCIFSHCHALGNGYISSCSAQIYVCRLNAAFNLNYPIDDKIDIYHTSLNGWEINKTFEQPHDFCRYCGGGGLVPFKWKTCPKGKARASDWIIEPDIINVKVIPVVQGIMKSSANLIRNITQRPKSSQRK